MRKGTTRIKQHTSGSQAGLVNTSVPFLGGGHMEPSQWRVLKKQRARAAHKRAWLEANAATHTAEEAARILQIKPDTVKKYAYRWHLILKASERDPADLVRAHMTKLKQQQRKDAPIVAWLKVNAATWSIGRAAQHWNVNSEAIYRCEEKAGVRCIRLGGRRKRAADER